jgi:transcriptional regulator with XRE-family HTH domain
VRKLSPLLAEAIRKHRESAGISQEELADRAELHRTYISLVERARRNLTVDALDRVALGLGIPASRLLAEAENARAKAR